MNQDIPIIDGIYDVTPALVPEPTLVDYTLILGLSVISVLFISYIFYKLCFSRRAKALQQIKQLKNTTKDSKVCAYEIANILQNYIGANEISPSTTLPGKLDYAQEKWNAYSSLLNQLRYSGTIMKNYNRSELFEPAVFWIMKWK